MKCFCNSIYGLQNGTIHVTQWSCTFSNPLLLATVSMFRNFTRCGCSGWVWSYIIWTAFIRNIWWVCVSGFLRLIYLGTSPPVCWTFDIVSLCSMKVMSQSKFLNSGGSGTSARPVPEGSFFLRLRYLSVGTTDITVLFISFTWCHTKLLPYCCPGIQLFVFVFF